MTTSPPSSTKAHATKQAAKARQERLALALRANLHRRKIQIRALAQADAVREKTTQADETAQPIAELPSGESEGKAPESS